MKVLYLNHTSQISGGERSLLSLLGGLPDEIEPSVACPEGPLATAAQELGVPVDRLAGTQGSLKLHPWYTTQAVLDLARSTWTVRRLCARNGADLVHANSIRAGLAGAFAPTIGGKPAVVHVHDCLPPGRLSSLTMRAIGKRAAVVIANSQYTRASFARDYATKPVRVVHGPADLDRFDPASITRSAARARLGLDSSTFVLAVIAQITPWKAQDDAIRALAMLKASKPDVRLLLVGSPKFIGGATRYDNRAYALELERLSESLGVGEEVVFLGERDDIPQILRATDVLLAPSWEEPFGLAIVEAMAMQVPVVATRIGGPSEIVRHGEEGLLLEPRTPAAWAAAVERLTKSPRLRDEMGDKGRQRAVAQFGVEPHVRGVLAAYDDALATAGSKSSGASESLATSARNRC